MIYTGGGGVDRTNDPPEDQEPRQRIDDEPAGGQVRIVDLPANPEPHRPQLPPVPPRSPPPPPPEPHKKPEQSAAPESSDPGCFGCLAAILILGGLIGIIVNLGFSLAAHELWVYGGSGYAISAAAFAIGVFCALAAASSPSKGDESQPQLVQDVEQQYQTLVKVGTASMRRGQYDVALATFEEALTLKDHGTGAMNNAACCLLNHLDSAERDPKRAYELSYTSNELTKFLHPPFLDTLAAACSALDLNEEALKWQRKAVYTQEDPPWSMVKRLQHYEEVAARSVE